MMMLKEALLYDELSEGAVRCNVCPRRCVIGPGKRGFCRTRENRGGKLYTLIYGEVVSMAIDPIEKKPLFNFWPGSLAFSIACPSCNFRCRHCQNWTISQVSPAEVPTKYYGPEDIVRLARERRCKSIAYTYTEPIIWYEFILDTARLAKKEDICNVLVTNGFITLDALDALAPYIDAANVDIKAFAEKFYHDVCGATLQPVLDATKAMVERGIFVETTNLIIPGYNDGEDETRELARWQRDELGPDVPLHFSRFYPHYKMAHVPPTPTRTLAKARDIALEEGLHYVYVGNVPGHEGESTYCPKCNELLVGRFGYDISEWKLTKGMRCPKCDTRVNIVGSYEHRRWGEWLLETW